MAPRHPAGNVRPLTLGVMRSVIPARLAMAAFALGVCAVLAYADGADGGHRPPDANIQRTTQDLPPARVILPAPWEQASPVAPPAGAPERSTDRR